eukprot:scaffold6927_cov93-Cylindrotheca_fusiformis.AAC.5
MENRHDLSEIERSETASALRFSLGLCRFVTSLEITTVRWQSSKTDGHYICIEIAPCNHRLFAEIVVATPSTTFIMTSQPNHSDSLGDTAQTQRLKQHQGHSTLIDNSSGRLAHGYYSPANSNISSSRGILGNGSLQMSPLLSGQSQFPSDNALFNMLQLQGAQNSFQQEPQLSSAGAFGNLLVDQNNNNNNTSNPAVGLRNLVSSATASLKPNAFDTSSFSTETTSMSSGTSSGAATVRGNMMDSNMMDSDSNSRFITQAFLEVMAKRSLDEALKYQAQQQQQQQPEKQQPFASAIPSRPVEVAPETRKRPRDETNKIHPNQRPIKKRVAEQNKINSSISLPRQATYDQKWNQHYHELVAFREKHGHCRVPQKCEPKGSLSQWVKRQRYHRKHKPEIISEERIRKLDEIGFVWDAQELVWHTRFDELLEFKRSHGHCSVPYKYSPNQKLATWVKCQRRQYQLLQRGKQSHLTPEREKLLGDAGFVWNPRKSSDSDDE